MSAQTSYKFDTVTGYPGGIVDIAPYAIDTFLNENATGAMSFGVAVVKGTKAGEQIKLPVAGSSAGDYEGVTVNNLTTERDLAGDLYIRNKAAIGVMRYGRVYVKVATGVTPAYGDATYAIKNGDEAGFFTNSSSSTLAIKGRFISGVDAVSGAAMVELYNEANS